jgi:hypothetical protein
MGWKDALAIGGVLVALGLILRYGASSVALANITSNAAGNTLSALTLANPGVYPYYPPTAGAY